MLPYASRKHSQGFETQTCEVAHSVASTYASAYYVRSGANTSVYDQFPHFTTTQFGMSQTRFLDSFLLRFSCESKRLWPKCSLQACIVELQHENQRNSGRAVNLQRSNSQQLRGRTKGRSIMDVGVISASSTSSWVYPFKYMAPALTSKFVGHPGKRLSIQSYFFSKSEWGEGELASQ
jgi:hypothetical protein